MNLIPRSFYLDNFFDDVMTTNNMKCDIYEIDNNYHIEMDIPGFDKNDISIESKNGYLIISVSKENHDENNDKNYIRRERSYGKYERSFYLGEMDIENINAELKDGVLKITVPKMQAQDNRKIIEIK